VSLIVFARLNNPSLTLVTWYIVDLPVGSLITVWWIAEGIVLVLLELELVVLELVLVLEVFVVVSAVVVVGLEFASFRWRFILLWLLNENCEGLFNRGEEIRILLDGYILNGFVIFIEGILLVVEVVVDVVVLVVAVVVVVVVDAGVVELVVVLE